MDSPAAASASAAEGRRGHSLSGGPRGAGMLSPDIARYAEPYLLAPYLGHYLSISSLYLCHRRALPIPIQTPTSLPPFPHQPLPLPTFNPRPHILFPPPPLRAPPGSLARPLKGVRGRIARALLTEVDTSGGGRHHHHHLHAQSADKARMLTGKKGSEQVHRRALLTTPTPPHLF